MFVIANRQQKNAKIQEFKEKKLKTRERDLQVFKSNILYNSSSRIN